MRSTGIQVFDGFSQLEPKDFRAPVALTIGVFDGVHRGHQALLRRLRSVAGQGAAMVVSFAEHPRKVLSDAPPPLITSLSYRLLLMEELGVDGVVVLPFDARWARTEAEDFLELISRHIAPKSLILGANHHFGRARRGCAALAREQASRLGFSVEEFELRSADSIPESCSCAHEDMATISSTRIRGLIQAGELESVKKLLGRDFALFGEVIYGAQRGRSLGFPTANIAVAGQALPPFGVYIAEVIRRGQGDLEPGETGLPAVLNLGLRPTVSERAEPNLEVHLLDWSGDLYGATLEVRFLAHLRSERRFRGLEELREQIALDCDAARRFWSVKVEKVALDDASSPGNITALPRGKRIGSSAGRATD